MVEVVNNPKHQTLNSFFTVYFNIKTSLVQYRMRKILSSYRDC